MKTLLGVMLLLLLTNCRYKEHKPSYSIVEEDTIAIEKSVLDSSHLY